MSVRCITVPSPFSNYTDTYFSEPGKSIKQLVEEAGLNILPGLNLIAWVDDIISIEEEDWEHTYPAEGQTVFIKVIPRGGGGGGGKSFGQTLMKIALIAASALIPSTGVVLGGYGGFIATDAASIALAQGIGMGVFIPGWVASGAVMVLGSMLVNAIAPPAKQRMAAATGGGGTSALDASNTYSITGARNQANKYGVLPKIYGRNRVYPFYGAEPFTEIVGDNEYLILLFDVGYGPLELSEFKIGETPLEEFSDVEMVIHNGDTIGNNLEIYTNDVKQEGLSVLLEYGSDFTVRRTEPNIDRITFDISNPQLFKVSGSNYVSTSVTVQAEIRKVGEEDWESAFGPTLSKNISKIEWQQGRLVTGQNCQTSYVGDNRTTVCTSYTYHEESSTIRLYFADNTKLSEVQSGGIITVSGATNSVNNGDFRVQSITNTETASYVTITNNAITDNSYDEDPSSASALISSLNTVTISDSVRDVVKNSYSRYVDNGQYDVRLKRLTENADPDTTFDETRWSALRSIKLTSPSSWDVHVTQVELRIKATDQLNGVIDQFNCIAEALIPVYDSTTETWTTQKTRNPAWAFCDALMGEHNKKAVPERKIYLPRMVEFADRCTTQGWNFDHVYDYKISLYDALTDIAASARASRGKYDYKHCVVMDRPQTEYRAVITPRNSWGFTSQITYTQKVHALKIPFIDENNGYEEDEQIVYNTGYTEENATNFETIEALGITNAHEVYLYGFYQLSVIEARRELYTVYVDLEHLSLNRGEMFYWQHDVPLHGVGAARISEITEDDDGNAVSVIIDDRIALTGNETYIAVIRTADNTFVSDARVYPTSTMEYRSLTFGNVGGAGKQAQVGDLLVLYLARTNVVEMVVASITPDEDYSAQITFQDHAPGVHNAPEDGVPEWEPNITRPTQVARQLPPTPQIGEIQSDEKVLYVLPDGSLRPRIQGTFTWEQGDWYGRLSHFQAQAKRSASSQWQAADNFIPPTARRFYADYVSEGDTYDLRIRAISDQGVASKWSLFEGHTVVGKTSLPPDVDAAFIEGDRLVWSYPSAPVDLAGFRVRYNTGNNPSWETATPYPYSDVTITTDFIDITWAEGQYTFLVKAIDTSGNRSENAAVVLKGLGDLLVSNVVEEYQLDPTFEGTKIGCSVVGDNLVSDGGDLWTGNDSFGTWTGINGNEWWTAVYSSMTYDFTVSIDEINDGDNMLIQKTMSGRSIVTQYTTDNTSIYWTGNTANAFWNADSADANWLGPDSYRHWPGVLGAINPYQYFFRISATGGTQQAILSALSVIVDADDIIERLNDVTIPSGGTVLPITKSYRSIKNISLTLQDTGGDATNVRYVDKAVIGPTVKAYAGTIVATEDAVIDVTIQGY